MLCEAKLQPSLRPPSSLRRASSLAAGIKQNCQHKHSNTCASGGICAPSSISPQICAHAPWREVVDLTVLEVEEAAEVAGVRQVCCPRPLARSGRRFPSQAVQTRSHHEERDGRFWSAVPARDGEVGDALKDRCCQWTEARVKMELRARKVELQADQLVGVTGEVLLLLDKSQDLVALGITDFKVQRKIIDFAHDRGRSDPVGKLRLGLERPVVHSGQGTVDDDARLACYRSMSCALHEDGPCPLLPMELVREWTKDFGGDRLIGEGAFGKVYEGVVADDQADRMLGRVAVKQLSREVSEGVQHHAKREINALSRSKHPHIIRLLGHTDVKRNPVCLVYEMGSRGSLGNMLRSDDGAKQLTWRIRVRVASGLVAALNYLHCHDGGSPVFHRDVKSDNVVLTADFQAKLIDCGLAKYAAGAGQALSAGTVVTTAGVPVGTALYCCPQYWKGKVDFDAKCEVFSVGVVLLELISGRLTSREVDLYEQYIENDEPLEADHRAGKWRCLEEVEALAGECLKKPKGRISNMMTVMRRLKGIEEEHCKATEEERVKAEELRRAQREVDAARVQGVQAEKLKVKLEEFAAQLTAHTAEQQRAAQRQAEAQQMKREQRQARLRSCLVCFDDEVDVGDGVECTGEDTHFLCRECLNGSVRHQLGVDEFVAFRRSGRRIRCVRCPRDGAAACYDTSSFTPLLEPDVFELYLRMREEVVVSEAMREQQGRYERQVEQLEEKIANLVADKMDAVVPVHMKKLIDDVLTDKCPRCKRAFFDFDGCFALTCSGCGCGFCAYCLADCGSSDTHKHVRNCQHNIAPGRDVFSSNGVWLQSQLLRRRRKLKAFIETIGERAVRGCVLDAARKELEDVGIDVAELLHLM